MRASRLGHKAREKNSVHNLRYGPRTRLIRGIYFARPESKLYEIISPNILVGAEQNLSPGQTDSQVDVSLQKQILAKRISKSARKSQKTVNFTHIIG